MMLNKMEIASMAGTNKGNGETSETVICNKGLNSISTTAYCRK